jgi:hypothetical protein
MKIKINQAPVLTLPNLQNPFKVETYASGYAMGAVLMQGGRHVCYHSEIFHGEILNYPTYDKELYALGSSCQEVEALSDGKGDHHPHRSPTTIVFVGPE